MKPLLTLLIAAVALVCAAPASAAVPDAPWTGTGTAITTVISDGSTDQPKFSYMTYEASGGWTASAVAKTTRTQAIDYRYIGYHGLTQVRAGLQRFIVRDGKDILNASLVKAGPVNHPFAPAGASTTPGPRRSTCLRATSTASACPGPTGAPARRSRRS